MLQGVAILFILESYRYGFILGSQKEAYYDSIMKNGVENDKISIQWIHMGEITSVSINSALYLSTLIVL
jgi:hypothetical protein